MSWLADIRHEVGIVVERVGEESVAQLGFLLSSAREGSDQARQELVASPHLQGSSAEEVLSLLTVAIGADAAREASESGALGDAVLDGAESEDVADLAADSIDFNDFLQARLVAGREALEAHGIPMSVVSSEDQLRISYLSKESYQRFAADAVRAELAERGP